MTMSFSALYEQVIHAFQRRISAVLGVALQWISGLALLQRNITGHRDSVKAKYEYRPLDASRREIRVLNIERGNWTDPISCSVTVSPLKEIKYDCLSYAWQGQVPSVDITIDGPIFQVTPTVYTALRRLRNKPGFGRWGAVKLWVDSICINQTDNAEKGHQVSIMGAIYSHAKTVHVWLDEVPLDWADPAINELELEPYLEDVSETTLIDPLKNWLAGESAVACGKLASYSSMQSRPQNSRALLTLGETRPRAYDAFQDLLCLIHKVLHDRSDVTRQIVEISLASVQPSSGSNSSAMTKKWRRALLLMVWITSRPWWSRVWVLQEAGLAKKKPILRLGSFQVDLHSFVRSFYEIQSAINSLISPTSEPTVRFWLRRQFIARALGPFGILRIIKAEKEGLRPSLTDFLTRISDYDASVPRDRLFAILSLVPSSQAELILPDYSLQKTTGHIFSDATRNIIHYYGDLRHLYQANGLSSPDVKHEKLKEDAIVPSWALSWIQGKSRDLTSEACSWEFSKDLVESDLRNLQSQDGFATLRIFAASTGQRIEDTSTAIETSSNDTKANISSNYVKGALNISLKHAKIDFPKDQRFQRALFPTYFVICSNSRYQKSLTNTDLITDWCCRIWNDRETTNEVFAGLNEFAQRHMVNYEEGVKMCFFVTSSGKLGHARCQVEKGDELFAIPKIHHAAVLRPLNTDRLEQPGMARRYLFIGLCYLEDFDMHELIRRPEGSIHCNYDKYISETESKPISAGLEELEIH